MNDIEKALNYYSGTSGLVLPVANKSFYPPEYQDKTRLTYYASLFNSIEINSSFYKIPQAKTVAKWTLEVPAYFKFTFKLWQNITHNKGLLFNPDDVKRFMQSVDPAAEKKGCLLVQFPPGVHFTLFPMLKKLISEIRKNNQENPWKIALEFRHASWYNDTIREFMEYEDISMVIHDIPASATPTGFINGDTVYLRFHGPGGKYSGSYPDSYLHEYSTYINEWRAEGKNVYVYFNNTLGDAVNNLITLNGNIRSAN